MLTYFSEKKRLQRKLYKVAIKLCATREALEGKHPIISREDGQKLLDAEASLMEVVDNL